MDDLGALRDRPVRVLVVKLSSFGDIVHVTGVLRAVRRALPSADVAVAVESRWRDVLAHDPHVDRIVESSSRTRLSLGYLAEIRRVLSAHGPFDIAIDLQGNRRSAAWIYLSGSGHKAGRGRLRPGWRRAVEPDPARHAVEVCAEVCRSVGIPVDDPSPELHTSPAAEERVERMLAERGLPSDGFVLLNPFSRWSSKDWPIEIAAEVIRGLVRATSRRVVLCGGPEDRNRATALLERAGGADVASIVGSLALGEALCLFRRGRLMVSCDSGPMHAAAAFGVPTIGLFGPTHPERTGPWGPEHRVIQASRPPTHHTYRSDPDAAYMRRLDADTILTAILEELARNGGS